MSFRTRLTLASAAAVAVAVVGASAITYALVRSELRSQVDETLRERAATLRIGVDGPRGAEILRLPHQPFGGAAVVAQVVRSDGQVISAPEATAEIPVTSKTLQGARGEINEPFYEDARVAGTHLRVLSLPSGEGGFTLQVARSLEEVDQALSRIGRFLIAIAIVGTALAAGLGLLVARAVLAPVQRLTRTAEEVSETRDLSRRIDASRNATSSRGSPRPSTPCSARSRSRRGRSGSSSPTRRTSCARR